MVERAIPGKDPAALAGLVDRWMVRCIEQVRQANGRIAQRIDHLSRIEGGLASLVESLKDGLEQARPIVRELSAAKQNASDSVREVVAGIEKQVNGLLDEMVSRVEQLQQAEREAASRVKKLVDAINEQSLPIEQLIDERLDAARTRAESIIGQTETRLHSLSQQFETRLNESIESAIASRLGPLVETMSARLQNDADRIEQSLNQSMTRAQAAATVLDTKARSLEIAAREQSESLKADAVATITSCVETVREKLTAMASETEQQTRQAVDARRQQLDDFVADVDSHFTQRLLEAQLVIGERGRQFEKSIGELIDSFVADAAEKIAHARAGIADEINDIAVEAERISQHTRHDLRSHLSEMTSAARVLRESIEESFNEATEQMTETGRMLLEQLDEQLQSRVEQILVRAGTTARSLTEDIRATSRRLEMEAEMSVDRAENRLRMRIEKMRAQSIGPAVIRTESREEQQAA